MSSTDFTPVGTEEYPVIHEIANAVTHGIGVAFSFAALFVLVFRAAWYAPESVRTVAVFSYWVFGLSLVLLYTASTVYHAVWNKRAKQYLNVLDHSAIYVLIAGSYTAFALNLLGSSLGWTIVGLNWALAIVGIATYAVYGNRLPWVSLGLYLFMGWLIIFAIRPLILTAAPHTIWLLLLGGLSYTFGCYFFVKQNCWWAHPVWHLFVLGGSFFHVLAAYWIY